MERRSLNMFAERELKDIISENFNITDCVVLGQSHRTVLRFFSTKGNFRKNNGFIYLINCDCTYTLADGKRLEAKKGDIVYLPPFCEYTSHYKNFSDGSVDGILVNLMFSDSNGQIFYLPNQMRIFNSSEFDGTQKLFVDILSLNNQPVKNWAAIKSVAYKILSHLGTMDKQNVINIGKYGCISKGIIYLEKDVQQSLSIEEIARMCNVTSTYFRKLFKEYSGDTPSSFRIKRKMNTAKELLLANEMSVNEVSDYLGFENVSYFSRLFKKYENKTPTDYRNELTR